MRYLDLDELVVAADELLQRLPSAKPGLQLTGRRVGKGKTLTLSSPLASGAPS